VHYRPVFLQAYNIITFPIEKSLSIGYDLPVNLGSKYVSRGFSVSLAALLLLFFVTFSAVHSTAHADGLLPNHSESCEVCKVLAAAGGIGAATPTIATFGAALVILLLAFQPLQKLLYSRDHFQSRCSRAPPALA
jgi:hypothetical protein